MELPERSRRTIKQRQETSPLEKQVRAERNAGTSQSWEDGPEEPAIHHHLEAWSPAQHSRATITTPDSTPSHPLLLPGHHTKTGPQSTQTLTRHGSYVPFSHTLHPQIFPCVFWGSRSSYPKPRPSPSSLNSWVTLLLWWVPRCPLRTWPLRSPPPGSGGVGRILLTPPCPSQAIVPTPSLKSPPPWLLQPGDALTQTSKLLTP